MPRTPLTTAALFAAMEAAHGNVAAAARALRLPAAALHTQLAAIPEAGIPDVVLWHRLRYHPGRTDIRDTLIARYMPLNLAVALRLKARVPRHVDLDTLVSAGQLGLLEAVDRYDHTRPARFCCYATPRIRGAMLDELRRLDSASHHVRQWQAQREVATVQLASQLGRQPTPDELREALNWTPTRFAASVPPVIEDLHRPHPEAATPGDEPADEPADIDLPSPPAPSDASLAHAQSAANVARATWGMPFEHWILTYLYYSKRKTLREIGDVLDLSQARCSMMRHEAITWLREHRTRDELIEVLM